MAELPRQHPREALVRKVPAEPPDAAVWRALADIPSSTLQSWIDRGFATVASLAEALLAARAADDGGEPGCPTCVAHKVWRRAAQKTIGDLQAKVRQLKE